MKPLRSFCARIRINGVDVTDEVASLAESSLKTQHMRHSVVNFEHVLRGYLTGPVDNSQQISPGRLSP